MKRKAVLWSVLGIFVTALLAGCCGGGHERTAVITQPVQTIPVGEELIKLKEAYDKGAITKEEYEKQKEQILKEK